MDTRDLIRRRGAVLFELRSALDDFDACGESDALAAFGPQRGRAGIDMLGDIQQPVRPLRDDPCGGARCEPRAVRIASRTPVCASIDASRADTACCISPSSRPAAPRLPALATAKTITNADNSGIREAQRHNSCTHKSALWIHKTKTSADACLLREPS